MRLPLFLRGDFQIITELKTFFLTFILHFPIYFDTITPTNQPSHHEIYFLSVAFKTKLSLASPHTNHSLGR